MTGAAVGPVLGQDHQTYLHRITLDIADHLLEMAMIANVAIVIFFALELSGTYQQLICLMRRK